MSLWDDAVNFVTSTYSDSQSAYEDLRNYLPGTIIVGDLPVPLKSTLDVMFGSSGQRGSVLEAYAIIYGGARQGDSAVGSVVTSSAGSRITEDAVSQLIIPGCFQVSIDGVSGAQPVVNVIGVQNAGGTAAGAAAAVQTAWKVASGPLGVLSSSYALTGFIATDIGDPNGDIVSIGDTTAGGGTVGVSTNAASALVSWNGGTRSRSSRGRLYFGPLQEANINADGRTLASSFITTLTTAFGNFRTSLSSSGYPLVVLSRVLSQSFPVTTHTVESVIATQRRRIR